MKILALLLLASWPALGGVITATRAVKAHGEFYRTLYQYEPTNRWWCANNSNIHYKATIDVEHIKFYTHAEERQPAGSILGTYVPEGCEWHDNPTGYLAGVMGWPFDGLTNETMMPVGGAETTNSAMVIDRNWTNNAYTKDMEIKDLRDEMVARGERIRKLEKYKSIFWATFIAFLAMAGIASIQTNRIHRPTDLA